MFNVLLLSYPITVNSPSDTITSLPSLLPPLIITFGLSFICGCSHFLFLTGATTDHEKCVCVCDHRMMMMMRKEKSTFLMVASFFSHSLSSLVFSLSPSLFPLIHFHFQLVFSFFSPFSSYSFFIPSSRSHTILTTFCESASVCHHINQRAKETSERERRVKASWVLVLSNSDAIIKYTLSK